MSERRLRRTIGVLTLIGFAIATYLTIIHYSGDAPLCLASGGCEKVQSSEWAKLFGIPVAVIGLSGYVLIFISLFVPDESGRLLTATLAIVGFAFSAYLTYRELFDIKAICQWCVGNAVVMTVIAVFAAWMLIRGPDTEETDPDLAEA